MRRVARTCLRSLLQQSEQRAAQTGISAQSTWPACASNPELLSWQQPSLASLQCPSSSVRHASWVPGWLGSRVRWPGARKDDVSAQAAAASTSELDDSFQQDQEPPTFLAAEEADRAASSAPAEPTADVSATDLLEPEPLPEPSYFPLPLDSPEVASYIEEAVQASDLAALALARGDAWLITTFMMSYLTQLHEWGLPWWASIAAVHLSTKVFTAPAFAYMYAQQAKMMHRQKTFANIQRMNAAAMTASSPEEAQEYGKAMKALADADTAKYGSIGRMQFRSMAPMLAASAVFSSTFFAVRALLGSQASELVTQGPLWFPDLTVTDPYKGLSIVCATLLSIQAVIATQPHNMPAASPKAAKWFRYGGLGLAGFFTWYISDWPAGMLLIMVVNSIWGIGQGHVLRSDWFRTRIGMPTLSQLAREAKETRMLNQEARKSAPSGSATGAAASQLSAGAATAAAAATLTPAATVVVENVADYDHDKATKSLREKLQKEAETGQPVLLSQAPPKTQKKRRARY